LLFKSTRELHEGLEGDAGHAGTSVSSAFAGVVGQIMLLDIVFSLDSVITAVGMARHLPVMIGAVVLAVGVMMFAAAPISDFVHRHPTVKMLALSFLLMIGVSLIADGLGQHIAKGYIYFAMGFSVFVEMLNIRMRARTAPVKWREAYEGSFDTAADQAIAALFEPGEQAGRLDALVTRAERDVAVNPSTRLPGTTEIEREIKRRMELGEFFAVCYADLDHFKEYNDRYSYNDGAPV